MNQLREGLEIETQFTIWFDRMLKYGFEENVDYVAANRKRLTAQGNETAYNEYYISIDMAKEICMI